MPIDRRAVARYALAALLLVGSGLALLRARGEARILETERRAVVIAQGAADPVAGAAWLASRCASGCDDREAMAVATAELALAEQPLGSSARHDLTARATTRLRDLTTHPATRAGAWARLAAVSNDPVALTQSYAAAPFLRGDAPVRLRLALAAWPQLDATTRTAVLREGAWFAQLDNQRRDYVDRLFAGHVAEVAYRLRLPLERPVADSARP